MAEILKAGARAVNDPAVMRISQTQRGRASVSNSKESGGHSREGDARIRETQFPAPYGLNSKKIATKETPLALRKHFKDRALDFLKASLSAARTCGCGRTRNAANKIRLMMPGTITRWPSMNQQ